MKTNRPASTPPSPPKGAVTFLLTDLEGSTALWEKYPEAMKPALARHDTILRDCVHAHRGYIVKMRGDGIHAAFANASDALAAAISVQRTLRSQVWGETGPLRVRTALHSGLNEERDQDYFGPSINRAARLMHTSHGGQILLSFATQELIRDHPPENILLRDLGEHWLKDLIRPERIFQAIVPDLPADFPPLNTLNSRPHNLPAQPTSLIGREKDLAAIDQILRRAEVRLLTISGPGGVGKTRLALQAAANILDAFQHGVYFINLASTRDAGLLLSTIAQTLGVRESGTQSLGEKVGQYLRDRQILLLLDSFEHVVPAAPLVSELLGASAQLKIIVTSREVLHLRGEHEFFTPPLALPDVKRLPPIDQFAQYPAVALFIQRALAVQPEFAVTRANALAVAEICTRLDGLPLAIELAAARCKVMSPQVILQRLEDRFALLTGGTRDSPARQQTLRATMLWSFDLLDADEKTLFVQLGVFVGGCSLQAAEAVCGTDAFGRLESLVNKSLLRLEEIAFDETRVLMLETISEFARERLTVTGQAPLIRQRHMEFYLNWVERAESRLKGAEQVVALNRLEAEHDNLRAASRWAMENGNSEVALRLGIALNYFWLMRGYFSEARERFTEALALPIAAEPRLLRLRAQVLYNSAAMALWQSDYAVAAPLLDASLALFRELGDKPGITDALEGIGQMAWQRGDYALARSSHAESLAIRQELGHKPGIAGALMLLGIAIRESGDFAEGRRLLEEALTIHRQVGTKEVIARNLMHLGSTMVAQADPAATARLTEALTLFQELGHTWGAGRCLHDLGQAAARQANYDFARSCFVQSIALLRELEDRRNLVKCIEGLAGLAVALGHFEQAARLFGSSEAVREKLGTPLPPSYRSEHARTVAALVAQANQEQLEKWWSEGRTLSLEQATEYALRETA